MPIYSPGNNTLDMLLQKLAGYNRKVTALPGAANSINSVVTYNSLSFQSDGTRWLSVGEYTSTIVSTALTGTTALQFVLPRSNDLYITRLDLSISQVNAGSGANFWSWALGTGMAISSGTVDTKLQGAGATGVYAYTAFTGNPLTLSANTIGRLVLVFTLNGAPGNATLWATLTYRKVGS